MTCICWQKSFTTTRTCCFHITSSIRSRWQLDAIARFVQVQYSDTPKYLSMSRLSKILPFRPFTAYYNETLSFLPHLCGVESDFPRKLQHHGREADMVVTKVRGQKVSFVQCHASPALWGREIFATSGGIWRRLECFAPIYNRCRGRERGPFRWRRFRFDTLMS